MLLDDKGFVPGHTETKTYHVVFNDADLKKPYNQPHGCPIYSALTRAGVPVRSVGPYDFMAPRFRKIEFDARLKAISTFLLFTDVFRCRWARFPLRGRGFTVTV